MNGRLHLLRTVVALVVAVLLFVPSLGVLAGCDEEPATVDPQAVLSACSAKMKEIAGFHFVYEVHKPAGTQPGKGLDINRITGEVNATGDMQATIDAIWGGTPVAVGFISVSGTHYIQDPLSLKWQSMPESDSPVGRLSLGAGTIRIMDNVMEAVYEGVEKKGGAKTHHISGMVAAEQVDAIAGAVTVTEPFPTDIWVGVDDNYIYEVDFTGAATSNETEGFWRSITLSDLDTHFDIQAPQ
ncbi:MAG: LppX_LprAFG lipoprotein [Thermoleophilia bacterium]|nr:LppX_LprAFG lipoprotein [Thermoleophilia bacterium]